MQFFAIYAKCKTHQFKKKKRLVDCCRFCCSMFLISINSSRNIVIMLERHTLLFHVECTLKMIRIWNFCIYMQLFSKKHISPNELGWNHFSMKGEQFSQNSLSTIIKTIWLVLPYMHVKLVMLSTEDSTVQACFHQYYGRHAIMVMLW